MSDTFDNGSAPGDDSLVSRLRVVDAQPLATRAGAYAAMHEELARRLEGIGGLGDPKLTASVGDESSGSERR